MAKIYRDYHDEPKDVFLALPEDLASHLYALEMETYTEDCLFFDTVLPPEGRILEMGCGTGRVARYLAGEHRIVTGIDISLSMLRLARSHHHPHCRFLCMDMLAPAFRTTFDTVLIPYNTLNLLVTEQTVRNCLCRCREILKVAGTLVTQLFIPGPDFLESKGTAFQFQLFDRPGGGRIIKEILRKYQPGTQTMQLEERFRIRPMQQESANEDYHLITSLAAFSLEKWLHLFDEAGFSVLHLSGSYSFKVFDPAETSCCVLVLKR